MDDEVTPEEEELAAEDLPKDGAEGGAVADGAVVAPDGGMATDECEVAAVHGAADPASAAASLGQPAAAVPASWSPQVRPLGCLASKFRAPLHQIVLRR